MSYVGRGGEKLAWALDHFGLTSVVAGKVCCDLGSNVGGFVDCLLQAGARQVYSVDTSYGTLAWTLRNDERVVVMERTNALYVELPAPMEFITSDVGWTRQTKILPHVLTLLAPGGTLVSLLKPQYEADKSEIIRGKGRVRDEALPDILGRVKETVAAAGLTMQADSPAQSPFLGGKGGNPEFFMHLRSGGADKT